MTIPAHRRAQTIELPYRAHEPYGAAHLDDAPENAEPHILARPTVAVVGLGYVGLPTGLALADAGFPVIGLDLSARRLAEIRTRRADLLATDRRRLAAALDSPSFCLTRDGSMLSRADAVVICVPTPVTEGHEPDLQALERACAEVVSRARAGQTLILTSTTHVGSTRSLLAQPLERRGFTVGGDVFVAFAPERVDPGNAEHESGLVPRVLGGTTPACTARAAVVLEQITPSLRIVSSCEAAEMTKLYENTFRAVNIALAQEMATATEALGLDVIEVTEAAATKPYGFMPHYPSAGVGGHCIPCDPHYLLWSLRRRNVRTPVIEQAMAAIHARPGQVALRAAALLEEAGVPICEARVLVVGASYKPGVEDVRESPALSIMRRLSDAGASIAYHDPLVGAIELAPGVGLLSAPDPAREEYDLAIVVTVHAGFDYGWLERSSRVLDCTYRRPASTCYRIDA
jgi:UDP-N-acetyl-D-glucosamine dehydrogenase